MKAFTVMWRTIKALYEDLLLWVWLSVLWWIGTALVVTAAPATAGLHLAANRVANYKRVDSGFFWDGAKQRIGRAWVLMLINIVLLLGIAFNVRFYASSPATWAQIISIMWIWVLLLVMMASQYFFPLFWQQEKPSLRLILRNAFILALRHPLYSFLMLLFQILLIVVSIFTLLPIFLLTPAAVVLAANFGLVGILQEMGLAPEPPPGM